MNKQLRRAKISAVAAHFPERILTNADLAKMVDTNNDWIVERTGIKERHLVAEGEAASDLGAAACKKLLKQTGIAAEEIDLIITATATPDMLFPATACLIQHKIGATKAAGFDLLAACSSFIFALTTACKYVEAGMFDKVLLVGSDVMSSITDYTDRNTCVLFGDGAGVVLIEPCTAEDEGLGVIDSIMRVDGTGAPLLHMPGGGSLNRTSHETVDKKWHYIHQEGRQVFKFAVGGMAKVSQEILQRNNIPQSELDLLVPHQANLRIIEAVGKKMNLSSDKVAVNIDRYGNTTSATIPSCLAEAVDNKVLKRGKTVVLTAFGAGFTWGAVLLRWV